MIGMSATQRVLLLVMASALSLAGAGCSGGTSSTADEPGASQTAEDEVAENADETTDTTVEVSEETSSGAVRYLPELSLEDAAPGPRPLLKWAPVDGASRYTLFVLGADGSPYWAWSGSETAVHLGGFDDPDAVGPWVHESMTWTVAAADAAGNPIAISQVGALTP